MLSGHWGARGSSHNNHAAKTQFICTQDVEGQSGRAVRCGHDITSGGPCPNSDRHIERPVPFSFRSVYGSGAAFYFNGVHTRLRRRH